MTRILAAIILLSVANSAYAQRPLPRTGFRPMNRRPVTSPYLNLLRGNGRSFAFNYFRSVRPEQEFRSNAVTFNQSINQLQQRVNTQQQQINAGGGLTSTGHSATFQSLGGYFPGLPGSNRGGNLGGGRRQAPRAQAGRSRR